MGRFLTVVQHCKLIAASFHLFLVCARSPSRSRSPLALRQVPERQLDALPLLHTWKRSAMFQTSSFKQGNKLPLISCPLAGISTPLRHSESNKPCTLCQKVNLQGGMIAAVGTSRCSDLYGLYKHGRWNNTLHDEDNNGGNRKHTHVLATAAGD